MMKSELMKEFVEGCPVYATLLQLGPKGGQHADRRVYVDKNGIRYVMINGDPTSFATLRRIGTKVDVWF